MLKWREIICGRIAQWTLPECEPAASLTQQLQCVVVRTGCPGIVAAILPLINPGSEKPVAINGAGINLMLNNLNERYI